MMSPTNDAEESFKKTPVTRPTALVKTITARLRDNKRVRRTLPGWGRVHIDRQVPFLCVYRRSPSFEQLDMQNLVTSEAAYLYTAADKRLQDSIREIGGPDRRGDGGTVWRIPAAGNLAGAIRRGRGPGKQRAVLRPRFRIVTHPNHELGIFLDKFIESLSRIRIDGQSAHVEVATRTRIAPPKLRPLLPVEVADQKRCLVLGLEISPVFADLESGEIFPQVRRNLERQLTIALKRVFFQFARTRTTHRPPHYHALGRRATVKAVWRADRMLAEVSDEFDFLLHVSPINGTAAWRDFQGRSSARPPRFTIDRCRSTRSC